MADTASRFLLANLAAAIAVLLVLLIRKPTRRLFGIRLAYALWVLVPLVVFASLVPRVVEIVVSPLPVDSALILQPQPVFDATPPAPIVADPAPPTVAEAAASMPATVAPSIDPWSLGWLVWLAGAVAMAAWLAYGQSRFLLDARRGKAGPAVVGVLRPRIIVPADFEDRFEPKERDVILAHETIHLSRNDARINALVALTRCICWFNPMIHLAAHLMRIDQELACDATVAERHPKAKAVYASALLKAQLAMRPLPLGCYWPAGTEHPLTERIEMLKQTAPGRARRIAGLGALALLALGAGVSAWAAKPAEERFVEANEPTPPQTGFRADQILQLTGIVERVEQLASKTLVLVRAETLSDAASIPITPENATWLVELPGKMAPGMPAEINQTEWMITASGYAADNGCKPVCRLTSTDGVSMRRLRPEARASLSSNSQTDDVLDQHTPPANSPGTEFDPADPIHLLGTIEKIDFSDTTYVAFVRASSIAACPDGPAQANTALWELAPTPYWGDRDAVKQDLLNQAVYARGFNAKDKSCSPNCRMLARGVFKAPAHLKSIPYQAAFADRALTCRPALQPALYDPQQAPDNPSALSIAIASGDVRRIIANGGTAADVATALRERNGPQIGSLVDHRDPDPATAKFVRTLNGDIALAWLTQEGAPVMWTSPDIETYAPPGGVASLPTLVQAFPQAAPQTVLFAPQQSQPTPQGDSQELPPPTMRLLPAPVPENFVVAGPPPEFDVDTPVYLRGKVERIEFGDTKYVIFLRASSIARFFGNSGGESHLPSTVGAHANSDLWEFSPTNYFGDRDAIRADLMGKNVEASGVKLTRDCTPACRIKVQDLIMPRSSQVPQPRADESLITQFGQWYDTASQHRVVGKVERIEFSERTFDAFIRSEARGAVPGRLYQARSEYRSPRADIERELLNKTVTATGWLARKGINTFCDPVCGIYAISFTLQDRSQLTPAGAALLTPSPFANRPRGGVFMSIADFDAPITVTGRITRYQADPADVNPQLWLEASEVSPATTFGSKAGTVWVVAGFPFNVQDDWIGRTVVIRGLNAEDKRCQPQCLMAGDSIQLVQ